jgi:hypothetical protein
MKHSSGGDPFLWVFESYLLSLIGKLPQERREKLREMTPKLSKALGVEGTWEDIVAARMEMTPDLLNEVLRLWEEYKRHTGASHDPEQFAHLIAMKMVT